MSCTSGPNATTCGGSVVGTWKVTSSCLNVGGALNISALNVEDQNGGHECTSTPITGGSLTVNGTLTATATTFTDNTITCGTIEFNLTCLTISGTTTDCDGITQPLGGLGFTSATCTNAANGGCNCIGTVEQVGGFGYLSASPATFGTYTTSNGVLSPTGGSVDSYSYCVSGSTLTVTPQSVSLGADAGATTSMGSVVFQKQ